jgi:hypothetical protein
MTVALSTVASADVLYGDTEPVVKPEFFNAYLMCSSYDYGGFTLFISNTYELIPQRVRYGKYPHGYYDPNMIGDPVQADVKLFWNRFVEINIATGEKEVAWNTVPLTIHVISDAKRPDIILENHGDGTWSYHDNTGRNLECEQYAYAVAMTHTINTGEMFDEAKIRAKN